MNNEENKLIGEENDKGHISEQNQVAPVNEAPVSNPETKSNKNNTKKKNPAVFIAIGVVCLAIIIVAVLLIGGFFKGDGGKKGGNGGKNSGECTHPDATMVVDVKPTCFEDGNGHKVCPDCGKVFPNETIPTSGHNNINYPKVESTCYSWGNEAYDVCSDCGLSTYKTLEPTHNVVDGECSICNRKVITTAEELMAITADGDYVLGNNIVFEESVNYPILNSTEPFTGSLDGNGYVVDGYRLYSPHLSSSCYAIIYKNDGIIKNMHFTSCVIELNWDCRLAATLVGNNTGSIINCSVEGTVMSQDYAGGLVGGNDGVIENSYFKGEVRGVHSVGGFAASNNGKILNCYSDAVIHASSDSSGLYAGGFVGTNFADIEGCYALGSLDVNMFIDSVVGGFVGGNRQNISASYSSVNINCSETSSNVVLGGFAGISNSYDDYRYANIVNCYSNGDVAMNRDLGSYSNDVDIVGGFVGTSNNSIIQYCYSSGTVKANALRKLYLGGFVGSGGRGVENCFATGDVICNVIMDSGTRYVNGFASSGSNKGGISDSCYVSEEQNITVIKNGEESAIPDKEPNALPLATLLSEEWLTDGYFFESVLWDFSGQYPTIDSEYLKNKQPIEISNKNQLLSLSKRALSLDYVLTADINLGGESWYPIIISLGTFEGAGHTISGVKFAYDSNLAGFIGQNNGEIKNLNIADITTFTEDESKKFVALGGIAAINCNQIVNCSVSGVINLNFNSDHTSSKFIGGLCGFMDSGKITDSFTKVDVNIKHDANSSYMLVGGFVGSAMVSLGSKGDVERCYSTGDITVTGNGGYVGGFAGRGYGIKDCYSEGDVSIINRKNECSVGGFFGSGNAERCYSLGDVTAVVYRGGIAAGGFAGSVGACSGCYTLGNMDVAFEEGHGMSYQDYDVGGFVGYLGDNSYSGCYVSRSQVVKYRNEDFTNSYGTNKKYIDYSTSTILSLSFQKNTLGLSEDVWVLTEGENPTLIPYSE